MKLLIARHGFDITPEQPKGTWEMSKDGKNQVNQLSKLISKFKPDFVIHSGLPRSQKTAEMLKIPKNSKLIMNGLFAEQKAGTSFYEDTKDGFVHLDDTLGGGESYRDMYERVRGAWIWITSTFDITLNQRIVVIGHQRFLNFFAGYILGFNPNGFNMEFHHTSYLLFNVEEGWRPQLALNIPNEEYI